MPQQSLTVGQKKLSKNGRMKLGHARKGHIPSSMIKIQLIPSKAKYNRFLARHTGQEEVEAITQPLGQAGYTPPAGQCRDSWQPRASPAWGSY